MDSTDKCHWYLNGLGPQFLRYANVYEFDALFHQAMSYDVAANNRSTTSQQSLPNFAARGNYSSGDRPPGRYARTSANLAQAFDVQCSINPSQTSD
ncbi:hypothetical protein ACS0TY_029312 [Phlomoides rotata]